MSLEHTRRYFDWASTAVPDGGFSDAPFGNPSSRHKEGREARAALETARNLCAEVLGARAEQLYFTSGGSESNAIVLHGLLLRQSPGVILVSAAEHPSIRENRLVLERLGKRTGVVGVGKDGRVSPETLEQALKKYPDARFAAIMGVNNETGAVSDLPGLAEILARNRVRFHCDMVQAIGKIPADITLADSASISAHKLGGPRGIGLLYLRKPLDPISAGGGQERGVRPGTENVAAALAFAERLSRRARPDRLSAAYRDAGDRFRRLIAGLRTISACRLIPEDRGETDDRFSPYILQAACRGIPGEVMVRALDDRGFAVSTGSACSSARQDRPVLRAMGADDQTALEGFRISQGWSTTSEDIEALLESIEKISAQFGRPVC
ncbi:MAG: cysteine desulfurase [Spirochaetaceae bacterium]|jgi:cysteine desulfurase|nr:cysteine desulfurase [Spirochaetaceae bacterium]